LAGFEVPEPELIYHSYVFVVQRETG
jgi:hypothetical protein